MFLTWGKWHLVLALQRSGTRLSLWWGRHRVSTLLQHTGSFMAAHLHCALVPMPPHTFRQVPFSWHLPTPFLGIHTTGMEPAELQVSAACLPLERLEKALGTHSRLVWPVDTCVAGKPSVLGNWHDQALLEQGSPGRPQLAAGIMGNNQRGRNLDHLSLSPKYQKVSYLNHLAWFHLET